MAHRFIIDDQTGQLYKDFTGRRLTSAAEILKSERGLTPTLEFYLINVATDTGAVTAQTLTNAQLSVAIGSASTPPDSGFIKASFTQSGTLYESEQLNIVSLTAASLESAFNSSIQPVYNVGGLTVDQIGPGKWLLTMKKVGAITGSPSLNVENSDPPSGVEVTSVTTGDSDTRAQWIISLAQLPVASIAGGSFSAVTSGSFSGLSSSIALNTTGMLAAIARNIKLFEFSVIHNNQVLHRSTVEINESLDPTASGTVVVTSPSLFTLGSNAVNQGETIAISGGLTYDGTTLAAPFLPLAGGTMTGDALFNDGVKAIFGTSSDGLEILHDGSNSIIKDSGTGDLIIQGSDDIWLRTEGGQNYARFAAGGSVELRYANSKKFETTDTGATISGKLIVNGDLDVSGTTTTFNSSVVTVDDPVFTVGGDTAPTSFDNKDRGIEFRYFRSGESAKVGFFGYSNADDAFKLLTSATNNSEVFSGTLADLKASKTLLEYGSASAPSYSFSSNSDTGVFGSNDALSFSVNGSRKAYISVAGIWSDGNVYHSSTGSFRAFGYNAVLSANSGYEIVFKPNDTEAARFDSNGNFLIANTATMSSSNAERLIIGNGSGAEGITIFSGSDNGGFLHFADGTTGDQSYRGIIQYSHPLESFIFRTQGTTERMRLNSTGLGIGGAPSRNLTVASSTSNVVMQLANSTTGTTADNGLEIFVSDNDAGIVNRENGYLRFDTNNTEAARFDSDGHLLVNTTTSSADVLQSVATDARYAGRFTGSEISGSSFGLRVRAGYTSSDLPLLVENRSGTDLFKVKGDGSSHFNSQTTNTVATFESTDPGAGILLADDTGTSKLETSGAELRVSCDDDDNVNNSVIKFRLDGATKATLDSTGLGIGGTPSEKLTVDGNIRINGDNKELYFSGNQAKFRTSSASSDVIFETGTTELLRLDGSASSINVPDNVKLNFGAGDLRIFHDGSNSYIQDDSGTGDLIVNTNAFRLKSANNSESMITAFEDGAVNVMHNDITRLSTTSSGININGGITFDSTFSEIIRSPNSLRINIDNDGNQTDRIFIVSANSGMDELFRVQEDGNVGIGGTPNELLQIDGTSPKIRLRDTDASGTPYAHFDASDGNILLSADAGNEIASSNIQFAIDGTEAARFDSSGNLKLLNNLTISSAYPRIFLTDTNNNSDYSIINDDGTFSVYDDTNASHLMRLNSTGLGIGGSPSAFLHVSKDNSNSGNQFCVADTEGATAAIRTYATSEPQGLIINHYYAEGGSGNEYARYADFVSNVGSGAATKMRFITKNAANNYFTTIIDNEGRMGIGGDPSENADLTLGGGELCMAETTTPTADANFGKIYCKSDNKLYFQDGAGTEHEIAFV